MKYSKEHKWIIRSILYIRNNSLSYIPLVVWRDHVIPAGTTIVANMYSMHTSPSIYKNPEEFIPERFLGHTDPTASVASAKVEQRDHFNFGWGR